MTRTLNNLALMLNNLASAMNYAASAMGNLAADAGNRQWALAVPRSLLKLRNKKGNGYAVYA